MNRSMRMRLSASGCLLLALSIHAPSKAAWEVVPELQLGAFTEENPRLDADGTVNANDTVTSTVLTASTDIVSYNERGFLQFTPQLEASAYPDEKDKELESTNVFFSGRGSYQWQSVGAGFSTAYSSESILNAELIEVEPDDDPDEEDPDAVDTGRLTFIDEDRDRFWIRPYLDFLVSERNTLRLQALRNEVSYSGSNLPSRTGYVDTRVSAGIVRNANQRNQVSAILWVENYEAEANQNEQDTVRIEGQFTRPVSEVWALNLAAGVFRTDFAFVNAGQIVDNASTDFTLRIGLRKRVERSSINLDLARDSYPNATGFSVVRNEVSIYFGREMTPRLSARVGVRIAQSSSLDDVDTGSDREYKRAEVGIEWAIKPVLFLGAGYYFTAQEFVNEAVGETSSNAVYVGVRYRGLSRR